MSDMGDIVREHFGNQIEHWCKYINNLNVGIKIKLLNVKKHKFLQISKDGKTFASELVDELHEGYSEKRMHDYILGFKDALDTIRGKL